MIKGKGIFLLVLLCVFAGAPSYAYATPQIVEVTSKGGIKAWLMQSQRLPLISMRFAFRGGVEQDPADKQGLATLMTSLLTQGAGPYDDQGFQSFLAEKSIQMDVGAGRDALTGSLKTLRRNKAEAFRLLSLALTKPRFEPDVFTRLQKQQLTAIKFQIASPAWQARYALFQSVFGDHPYGFRSLGSMKTVQAITREDVVAFARQRLAKDNLVVVVVGDISAAELAKALDEVFGALPDKAAADQIETTSWPEKQTSVLVSRSGTQTHLVFATPMLRRKDPDWHAAEIANYILGGGGFVARLMKEVREKAGLTYGISTGLAAMDKASLLMGELSADNDKAAQAYALTKKIWEEFFKKGVSQEEVDAAKDHLTGSLPLALTSTDAAAAVLLSLQLDGFGADDLAKRSSRIQAVTLDDVNRVVRKWFNPALASFAFVGEPGGIETDQKRLLIGD